MESSPESTITQAFNPFVTTQAAYGMGATGLIYEPLIQFDLANPTVSYPWLATGLQVGRQRQADHLHHPVRRQVEQRLGADPGRRGLHLRPVKANASINLGGLSISSVTTSGNTVTLTFPTPQYTNLEEIAGTAIVPKAIWSKAGNPATFVDATPVGTGPYMLQSFTPQGFTLKKNPNYWQASKVKVVEGLLPGLHLQHRRPQCAVLRPDHLDRQLHPRAAEAVRRQGPGLPPLLGGRRR